jgi:diacylglycerol kinase (ATP)
MVKTNRKIYWVVNPACANGAGQRRWSVIEGQLRDIGLPIESSLTSGPNHATEITRWALYQGYDHIIVAGGDGTINEVVNGFYCDKGINKINAAAVLSVIPLGTGCDFARMFNLQSDLAGIQSICQGGQERACDLVRATYTNWAGNLANRFYLNVADMGLGCEIARQVNQQGKKLGGFLSFLLATLTTLAKVGCLDIRVTIDGKDVFSGPANLVAVANGQYFGGGMRIAPFAQLDDGFLDIIVLHALSRVELIINLPRVYSGRHVSHPKVSYHRGQQVNINSSDKLCVEMDGETPGMGDCRFQVLSSELRIVIPEVVT